MATYVNGTNMVLKIDDTSTVDFDPAGGYGGTPQAIAAATSCQLSINIDAPEVTTKDNGDRKCYRGLSTSWSVDADVMYNEDGSNVRLNTLFIPAYGSGLSAGTYASPLEANHPRRVYIEFLGNTGGNKYQGYGYITALSVQGGTEDAATYSITITGDGALSYSAS